MICLTLFVILWNLLVMSSDGQHIGGMYNITVYMLILVKSSTGFGNEVH